MAGRKDALRGLSGFANKMFRALLFLVFQNFKTRGQRLVALVPPENAPSDMDTASEPENEEEFAVNRTEECSSSPCPSIDSSLERMNILESSENETQGNSSTDSEMTNVEDDTFMVTGNEDLQTEDHPSVSVSENNPVLEVENNLNDERPPLTPIINNVLPPTGEVNYSAIPSFASLLSVPSSDASSIASPSTARTTRRKRIIPKRAVPNVRAKKTKKTLIVSYKWKKGQFRHKADIPSDDFVYDLPDTDSPIDFFYRFFSPDILLSLISSITQTCT
ncbi:unnamed protein product [Leptidea sinapis]|uniref:PiggyBac transposable element-derived protein domain-containing protein n=1 Tax=Leptidea sinapis TaxID=189913 RepID=A0A5E4PPQ9_9NEOP|nr:unnamed protein product [Leptidea sinapis]